MKLLPYFAVLLLLVSSVLGQMPNPVAGQVKLNGYPYPEGLIVEQTNLRTGIMYESVVDSNGFFVVGMPGETKEQMLKTLELNIAVKPAFASASIFQPYPGTTALEIAANQGVLPTRDQDELIDLFGLETFYNRSILVQDPEHKRWLEGFQKWFALAVANPQIYNSGVPL